MDKGVLSCRYLQILHGKLVDLVVLLNFVMLGWRRCKLRLQIENRQDGGGICWDRSEKQDASNGQFLGSGELFLNHIRNETIFNFEIYLLWNLRDKMVDFFT